MSHQSDQSRTKRSADTDGGDEPPSELPGPGASGERDPRREREREADPDRAERTRRRLSTAFGWVAGGALGLLVNYGLLLSIGESYPTTYTTFAFFLGGAFGGMALADRLGPRGFKPLGIAAGVLLALFVASIVAALMTPTTP